MAGYPLERESGRRKKKEKRIRETNKHNTQQAQPVWHAKRFKLFKLTISYYISFDYFLL